MKLLKDWEQEPFEGSAIYKIRLKNQPIERFLGKDKDGILAIGKTKKLKKRIKHFNKALEIGKRHSAGRTLFLNQEQFNRKFKYPSLWYSFRPVRECDLSNEEAREIKQYMKVFGELPPLNSAIPQKKKWIKEKQRGG